MARGTLVALVGIDGSGKSHQAAAAAARLRAAGHRARAFENPGGRPVVDGVARALGRADGAALVGQRARTAIEIAIRTLAIVRAVLWSRVSGGTAVLDRYAVCQLATMRARGEQPRAVTRLARLAPTPSVTVWLQVPVSTAQRRIESRGSATESQEWLTAFAEAYGELQEAWGLIAVDGDASSAVVARRIAAAMRPLELAR